MALFTISEDKNNKTTFLITSKMPANSKTGMRHGLYQYGNVLRREVREQIKSKDKSGRVYIIQRRDRRFRHRSSAPGETPANITGKLRNSVDFNVSGSTEMKFGYDDSVDYGRHLELGSSKIKPRPGLLNAIKKTSLQGRTILARNVNEHLKKK